MKTREEIDNRFKWKLEDIYKDDEAWERDFTRLGEMAKETALFKNKLNESPETLYKALVGKDELFKLLEKLYTYARMRRDEDNTNSIYQGLTDRISGLVTEILAHISFYDPEIIAMEGEKIQSFMKDYEPLGLYDKYFENLLREKEHILTKREEELLALTSEMGQTSMETFTMLNNADMRFPKITDEDGNIVELTKGNYIKFLESKNREVRKQAYVGLYTEYKRLINTFSKTLSGSIKKDKFYSSVRKYASSRNESLSDDNVPETVYDNLITSVHENLESFYEYVNLRKRVLGRENLNMYDMYVPLFEEPAKNIPYEEGYETVIKALSPLGEEYTGYLKKAYSSGWIDVFESRGKTSGAYSWGNYSTHPYVLLNYQGTYRDIFTIAHEMGHAMHTLYTNKTQPFIYSEYKIFVAEVASILNEFLLMDYLVKNAAGKMEKAYLINSFLDDFKGTLFRQTMFAEFEKIVHGKAGNNEPLTADVFNRIYGELNSKYYGPKVETDEYIQSEWARIPHFYSSFYVYKYATGFIAAAALSEKISEGDEGQTKKYIEFLKSGSSDYPIELLKKAGVDLTTAEPVRNAMDKYKKLIGNLKNILDEGQVI